MLTGLDWSCAALISDHCGTDHRFHELALWWTRLHRDSQGVPGTAALSATLQLLSQPPRWRLHCAQLLRPVSYSQPVSVARSVRVRLVNPYSDICQCMRLSQAQGRLPFSGVWGAAPVYKIAAAAAAAIRLIGLAGWGAVTAGWHPVLTCDCRCGYRAALHMMCYASVSVNCESQASCHGSSCRRRPAGLTVQCCCDCRYGLQGKFYEDALMVVDLSSDITPVQLTNNSFTGGYGIVSMYPQGEVVGAWWWTYL